MTSRKVIVFGPTGAVGSAAARTAEELGAKVVLAMRNKEKPIPGLEIAKENQGSFERVYADLTKPDTVRDAVNTTKAKYAFIYCAHGTPDHMKSTIESLKLAGIELVVFLSSYTIQGDPKTIQPSEVIPYVHAQVEINLGEIFGANGFVAARPGSFASNTRQYKAGLEKGEVKIYMPDAKVDCIVPEDIGRVCGTVLAKGPQDEQRAIYLYGPELLSQADSVRILAKVLGKNPKIEIIDEQGAYKMFIEERRMSGPLVKYMVGRMGKDVTEHNQVFGYPVKEEELSNVQKYSGKKATTFEEWVEQNKQTFVS
ncbi:NAD(P)-binding protein [Stipitochalara longipes BDJ]|nr:NAD(P)-binding protein [Stipitochalara longipes BDJ]